MQRRQFIRSSCNLCLLGAGSYFLSSISGCVPAKYPVINAEVINKKIFLPLSAFATNNMQIIRPKGWYYDIAVQKKMSKALVHYYCNAHTRKISLVHPQMVFIAAFTEVILIKME